MQTQYQVIYPDGRVLHGSVDWPYAPTYEDIKTLVGPYVGLGERIGRIPVVHDGRRAHMIVAARADGLAANESATALFQSSWIAQHPNTDPAALTPVMGVAVLFDRQVWL